VGANQAESFPPGTIPQAIFNTSLTSIPNPAVYTFDGTVYSFGFPIPTLGSQADANLNPAVPANDSFAFYQASSLLYPPTVGCTAFGYLYNVASGLCVTASKTEDAYPQYQGGTLTLEPCQNRNCTEPAVNQTFCTDEYTFPIYLPTQCVVFYGDATSPNSFYGPTYAGPSTVLIDGGDCIFVLFPA